MVGEAQPKPLVPDLVPVSATTLPEVAPFPLVIPTGAQRSGGTCGSAVSSWATPVRQLTLPGSAALPFVISTGALKERSGEICGSLQGTPVPTFFFLVLVLNPNEKSYGRARIHESKLTLDSLRYIVRYIEYRRRKYVWTRQI
jgi:hypothetical protein